MAAKVASLLIDVAADVAKLRTDFDAAGKQVSSFAARLTDIGKGIAAAFSVGEVIAFGERIQRDIDAMSDMAENLKLNVLEFQTLQNAALLAGQSVEATGNAMAKFNVFVGKASEGNKEAIDTLNALGVTINDLQGRAKPSSQRLQEMAIAITSITDPAKRAAAEVAVFGKSGQAVSAILEQWKRPLDEVNKQLQDMGLVHSPEVIKSMAEMADRSDIAAKKLDVLFAPMYAAVKSNLMTAVAIGFQAIANAINAVSAGNVEALIKVMAALGQLPGNPMLAFSTLGSIGNPLQQLDQDIANATKELQRYEDGLVQAKQAGDGMTKTVVELANKAANAQLKLSDLQAKRDRLTAPPVTVTATRLPGTNPTPTGTGGTDKYAEALRKIANETEALTAAQKAYNEAASAGLPTAAAERLAKHLEDIAKKQNELGKGLTADQAADIDKRVAALEAERFKFEELKRVQREGDAISRQYGDGQKELTETLYRLNEARRAQTITEGEYANALADANDKAALQAQLARKNADDITALSAGFAYAAEQFAQTNNAFSMGSQLFTNSINLMSNAISEFVENGSIDFGKLAVSFAKMLADMALRMALYQGLKAVFGAIGFGASATAPSGADVLMGLTRAGGGAVTAGQSYWVGERGPERFVPAASGNIIPASANGDTSGSVTVNLDMTRAERAQDPSSALEFGRRVKAAVVDVISNEKRPGGTLYAAR